MLKRLTGESSSSNSTLFSRSVRSTPRLHNMRPDRPPMHTNDSESTELLQDIARIRQAQGTYPDVISTTDVQHAVGAALHSATLSAQESLGWLRHALEDPADVASAAVGRMVSKEYGKHEPPHTEQHLWQQRTSPHPSPPSSPMASGIQPRAGSSTAHTPGQQQQQQGQHGGAVGPYPYSGPGFLLHRETAEK